LTERRVVAHVEYLVPVERHSVVKELADGLEIL